MVPNWVAKRYYGSMSVLSWLRTGYLKYGFLLVGILLVNVGLVNWYLFVSRSREVVTDSRSEEAVVVKLDDCDLDCVNEVVDARISLYPTPATLVVERETVSVTPTPKPQSGKAVPTPTPVARTEYVSLPDGSSLVSSDWTSMTTSKWIDTSLYGTLVSASWEGWLEMPGGSGTAYVRLFDATNGRAVDGSEVSMTNTVRSSFYSGNISLWRGQNQYYIQVKSTGGGTVEVDGARIKMVVR